jgi:hypoxanthine-DNA glycosylase
VKLPVLRSFRPVADARSRVLILGTMPGPVALARRQYYGFPGNHFWPIMGALFGAGLDKAYAERLAILRENRVALWDTIRSCTRPGAADADIACAVPNDIAALVRRHAGIRTIFLNGTTAERLYRKHFGERIRLAAFRLPSTSPAHASMPLAEKIEAWGVIRRFVSNRNPWC